MDDKDLERIKKKIDNAKDDKGKEIIEAAQKRQIEHEERIKLMKPVIDAIRKLKMRLNP